MRSGEAISPIGSGSERSRWQRVTDKLMGTGRDRFSFTRALSTAAAINAGVLTFAAAHYLLGQVQPSDLPGSVQFASILVESTIAFGSAGLVSVGLQSFTHERRIV